MSRFDDELRHAVAPLAGEPLPAGTLDEALDGPSATPRRWLAAAATTVALLVVIAVGVEIGRLTPEPSPDPAADETPSPTSDPSPQAVRHQVEVDGVRLTVELESDRATDGVPVLATATVENLRDESIWHSFSAGCEWATSIFVYPNPRFELGRTWDGDAARLKRHLLREWAYEDPTAHYEFTPYYFVGAERLPDLHGGCFAMGGSDEILAGASHTDELAWRPTGPFGMPIPSGTYQLTAIFTRVPPHDNAHIRDTADDVTLSFEIEIDGSSDDYLLPGEAIDSLLADERLWAMLVDARPERPGIAEIEWMDGVWKLSFTIGHSEGALFVTSHFINAEVDALTGHVVLLESTETTADAPPVEPASDSAEVEEVVRFTLSLDRDRTTPGQPIWADLIVENIGSEDVSWATTGGCPLWPAARSQDPPDDEPYGRTDWSGDADLLKRVIVGDGPDLEHPFRPEEYVGVANWDWSCDLMRTSETLGAGERHTYRSIWYAETRAGVPVTPGSYDVEAELAVSGTDELLKVSVPLTVVGADLDWIAPGEALDRLLEDAQFQALLAEYGSGRWNSQDLIFEDDRWKLRIFVSASQADMTHGGAVLGTLDGLTGHIYGVRFDPDARPPGFESEP